MCFKINNQKINEKLKGKKVLADLVGLFEKFPWNNILHDILLRIFIDIIRIGNLEIYKHVKKIIYRTYVFLKELKPPYFI